MKKVIVGLLAVILATLSVQPVQAEDQKVLAIIDTAIDSSRVPAVIYEACFTDSLSMPCINKQKFMEGKGAANLQSWPLSINNGLYHGYNVAQTALKTNSSVKIVFVRVYGVTPSGNSSTTPKIVIDALTWIANNAAKYSIDAVSISQSFNSSTILSSCNTDKLAISSVSSLNNQNIPVFAATGNDKSLTYVGFPACVPGVIGVGALGSTGKSNEEKLPNTFTFLQAVTNRGPGLDVVADGEILITKSNGNVDIFSATSAATPVAASAYILKNTYSTFGEFMVKLNKIMGYPYISR